MTPTQQFIILAAFLAACTAMATAGSLKSGRRIVGGMTGSSIKKTPWAVLLLYREHFDIHRPTVLNFKCGGSILTEFYVLTSAYCASVGKIVTHVRYATVDAEDATFTDPILAIHEHPEFAGHRNLGKHDIAIVELKDPILFSEYVSRVTLSLTVPKPGEIAIFTGWGRETDKGAYSRYLKSLNTQILDKDSCEDRLSFGVEITPDFICADTPNEGLCAGDAGGPLLVGMPPFTPDYKRNKFLQAGVASTYYGKCADPVFTDIYTSVPDNKRFIDKITRNTAAWGSQY